MSGWQSDAAHYNRAHGNEHGVYFTCTVPDFDDPRNDMAFSSVLPAAPLADEFGTVLEDILRSLSRASELLNAMVAKSGEHGLSMDAVELWRADIRACRRHLAGLPCEVIR